MDAAEPYLVPFKSDNPPTYWRILSKLLYFVHFATLQNLKEFNQEQLFIKLLLLYNGCNKHRYVQDFSLSSLVI